jgi:hypothetical protein
MSAPDPQALAAAMPLATALGIEVSAATAEEVRGRLAVGTRARARRPASSTVGPS